jgi:NADPH:quinone reductase-like Zn-dependent oxidoreductase
MKAAVHERYGKTDVVELREVDRPEPVGDQVLVRVQAASVNRADLDMLGPRPSFTRLFFGLRAPKVPRLGCDVAGIVEAVGPAVTRFGPGDRVFGDLYPFGHGAFAEYVCVPERALAAVPDALSFEDAATLPHSGILALQGLRLRDGRTLRPSDRVLIGGASGNVGPSEVTGVCSTAKVDFVRALGADHVIDYTTGDWTATGERYDWILDVEAHDSMLHLRRTLRPNGAYVTLGGSAVTLLDSIVLGSVISRATAKQMGLMFWWKPFRTEDVATLTAMVATGQVKPMIDRRYPLDEIVEALRYVDDGHALGKVVVVP